MEIKKYVTVTSEPSEPPLQNAMLTGKIASAFLPIPIPYATVVLGENKSLSALNGSFHLTVPVGTYTLQVNHFLFESFEQTVDMPKPEIYDVKVALSPKTWTKVAAVAIPTAVFALFFASKR